MEVEDGAGDVPPQQPDASEEAFWSAFSDDRTDGAPDVVRRRRPSVAVVTALLLVAALIGTGVGVLLAHRAGGSRPQVLPPVPVATAVPRAGGTPSTPATTVAGSQGAMVPVVAATSYDPSGGSGFVMVTPGSFTTQHYVTPEFGGLKPGAGLLLDLGRASAVSAVELTSAAAGTQGQLIGLDAPPAPGSVPAGAAPVDLTATVRVPGPSGGRHRYWLVFVTRLGDDGQGRYYAQLSNLRVLS